MPARAPLSGSEAFPGGAGWSEDPARRGLRPRPLRWGSQGSPAASLIGRGEQQLLDIWEGWGSWRGPGDSGDPQPPHPSTSMKEAPRHCPGDAGWDGAEGGGRCSGRQDRDGGR